MKKSDMIKLIDEVFDDEIEHCRRIMEDHKPPHRVELYGVIINMEIMRGKLHGKKYNKWGEEIK